MTRRASKLNYTSRQCWIRIDNDSKATSQEMRREKKKMRLGVLLPRRNAPHKHRQSRTGDPELVDAGLPLPVTIVTLTPSWLIELYRHNTKNRQAMTRESRRALRAQRCPVCAYSDRLTLGPFQAGSTVLTKINYHSVWALIFCAPSRARPHCA